jgi:hypothetical protein
VPDVNRCNLNALTVFLYHKGSINHMHLQGRQSPFEIVFAKGIAEATHDFRLTLWRGVKVNRSLLRIAKGANIIQPKEMVEVMMRLQDGINALNFTAQHLLAKVDRGINQE